MKYNGRINDPKDLVTKEYVDNSPNLVAVSFLHNLDYTTAKTTKIYKLLNRDTYYTPALEPGLYHCNIVGEVVSWVYDSGESSMIVDQNYNPTSPNAQSGVAVKQMADTKQAIINGENKLNADYIQDGTTNIIPTTTDESNWNNKQKQIEYTTLPTPGAPLLNEVYIYTGVEGVYHTGSLYQCRESTSTYSLQEITEFQEYSSTPTEVGFYSYNAPHYYVSTQEGETIAWTALAVTIGVPTTLDETIVGNYYAENGIIKLYLGVRNRSYEWFALTQQTSVDDSTIDRNALNQLEVKDGGISSSKLNNDLSTKVGKILTTEQIIPTETIGGYSPSDTIAIGTDLNDIVKKLLVKYYPPIVQVTSSNIIRHIGDIVSSFTMSITATKRTEDITRIEFLRGSSIVETITEGVASGGNFSHTFNDISGDITFTAKVYTTTTSSGVSGTNTVRFYHYTYYGSVDNAPTTSTGLSTALLTSRISNQVYTHTNKKACYCYPSSYGVLTSIKDNNGFEYLSDFTLTTAELEADTMYNVYTQNNPNSVSSFTYKFN